jgi:hypothetical protein
VDALHLPDELFSIPMPAPGLGHAYTIEAWSSMDKAWTKHGEADNEAVMTVQRCSTTGYPGINVRLWDRTLDGGRPRRGVVIEGSWGNVTQKYHNCTSKP